ncbi:MAG: Hsp70 family protein [Pirellulales bacterium]|nr:Hsp70 family protein [Pirellulales bacterium]
MTNLRTTETDKPSRYVVGIDLGTTNSAVTYVDTSRSPWRVETFAVPQLVAPGQVEARETLPSFHYQPASGELAAGALRTPFSRQEPTEAVGIFARDQGTVAPGRLIASAKSWLCHSGVDRTAALLPWHGAADVERISPVQASARYLRHIADAWGATFPQDPLPQQDVVLTLPASFDEIARELTVKAASEAGLPRVVLIEEPQAAFYAWLDRHADDWQRLVEPGQKILVCDIGGGTSDFTLIRVRRGEAGNVQFHRVAVGDHLILGGDNLDLALAHYLERKLSGQGGDPTAGDPTGQKLQPRQWAALVGSCRQLKEALLGEAAPERYTVNLPGGGARLIGGGRQLEVTRDEVREVLLEGFFPRVGLDEKPLSRQSGFQEFGLPYAPDPAITRCLAGFLTAHRHVALDETPVGDDHDPARPDVVLFNGGLFASPVLRRRLLAVVQSWFQPPRGQWEPLVLDNPRLDLAVARGAAYYGMVRRGEGVRIAAALARTYYVGVESEPPAAVCLVPAQVEPGQDVELTERRFDLRVFEPVEFPLYVSSTRLTDRPGELVPIDREQMTPLPPIRTVLRTRKKTEAGTVGVQLHARLTEIGTLVLWCSQIDRRRSWRLQFDVRSATQTDVAAHESAAESEGVVDEATWSACGKLLRNTFGPEGHDKPADLVKRLARAIGSSRNNWPASLLRRIWEALMELEPGRRRSPVHEARWLNLLGFSLRPGYGLAVDDWRVAQTWSALQGKILHPGAATRVEGWILWRRIGGGLAAGQQQAIAEPLLAPVRGLHRQMTTGKRRGGEFTFSTQDTAEVWRLLGSLELLGVAGKVELGNILLELAPKRKMEPVRPAMAWALGRLGARVPVYGPLNTVVPPEAVCDWLLKLMDLGGDEPAGHLAAMQMARRTGDRYRELPEKLRRKVLDWLALHEAPDHFLELVREGGQLDRQEQGLVFGEALPKGLRAM